MKVNAAISENAAMENRVLPAFKHAARLFLWNAAALAFTPSISHSVPAVLCIYFEGEKANIIYKQRSQP